jgi:predicted metal-binding protein
LNTSFLEYGFFRYVHFLLCGDAAGVRWTKTKKLMIRCESCKSILFANGSASQQLLRNLPAFNNKANEFYGTYYY